MGRPWSWPVRVGMLVAASGALAGAACMDGEAGKGALPAAASEELATAPPTYAAPISPDTYALVLVDVGQGITLAGGATGAANMMFGPPPAQSLATFYAESSYGQYQLDGGVFGPFAYNPLTTCSVQELGAMAQSIEQANPSLASFNHLVYYFEQGSPGQTSACSGLRLIISEGTSSAPARRSWLNGTLACPTLMQAAGANLGLAPANELGCPDASLTATPSTSCHTAPYGNSTTAMGIGCRQLNGYERWYEGWLSGCNGVRVTSTGTFDLAPLESLCPGSIQVLQIPLHAPLAAAGVLSTPGTAPIRDYYVELRSSGGLFDRFAQPVVVVYGGDDVYANATDGGTNAGETFLLNMTPDAGVTGLTAAGNGFQDPSGAIAITLESITAARAVVTVTIPGGAGEPLCGNGTTLIGQGVECVVPDAGGGDAGLGGSSSSSSGGGTVDAASGGSGGGGSSGSGSGSSSSGASGGSGSSGSSGSGSGSSGGAASSGAGGGGAGAGDASTPSDGGPILLPGPGIWCGVGATGVSGPSAPWAAGVVLACGVALRRRRRKSQAR